MGFEAFHDESRTTRLETEYAAPHQPGRMGPYNYQVRFHDLGKDHTERAMIAANRVGKTLSCAAEVAIHGTGRYPGWWKGHRFNRPPIIMVAGQTNTDVRDIQQFALCGRVMNGVPDGTGWLPKADFSIGGMRQCGVPDVIDYLVVRHVSGGQSIIYLKSYQQGWDAFTGRGFDFIWLDEEPDEYRIFSECQTRIMVTRGRLIFSVTPLKGMSEIVEHFLDGGEGIEAITVTWDDAPHISQEQREQWSARYSLHERKTRCQGIPMQGTGLVYSIDDSLILCQPFQIPDHYRRINGVDFGIDLPGAAAFLAYDPDADVVYLYDCYKESGQLPAFHAQAIRARGSWIPTAWPHDGMVRDKGTGAPLAHQYRERGVNMLPEPAAWEEAMTKERGIAPQSREAGAQELLERMHTGRFKVFDTPGNKSFLKEKGMIHRKDAQIVRKNDHIESAVRYAVMMLRYATTDMEANMPPDLGDTDFDPLAEFSRSRR